MPTPAQSVGDAWDRIEAWAADNCPQILVDLAGPCKEASLARLEEDIGMPVPESFRASYERHDGQRPDAIGFIGGMQLLSLRYVRRHRAFWADLAASQTDKDANIVNEHCRSDRPGAVKPVYANGLWVPFAYDRVGNHLGIDLDPGPNGVAGQIVNFGCDQNIKYVMAPSLEAFMHWYADQLEAGRIALAETLGHYWFEIIDPPDLRLLNALPKMIA
ncbi:MAG: beta-1 3-glucan biosynthesis protein [Phycisphaera sp.]|nr:beta-1 3-glucan biosynthesis protein [Phycisphaera sp.]